MDINEYTIERHKQLVSCIQLINGLIKERNVHHKKSHSIGAFNNPQEDEFIIAEIVLEMLTFEILEALITNYRYLQPDFVLESLTHLGHAPTLANDDNGMWAVSGSGMQPVVFGNQRIEGTITIVFKKKQWFKTIRLAVFNYLLSCRR